MKNTWKHVSRFTEEWILSTPAIYLPLLVLVIVCFVPAIQESNRVGELETEAMFRQLPEMTASQIRQEVDCLLEEMKIDGSDPQTAVTQVFELTDRSIWLEQVFQKNLARQGRLYNPQLDDVLRIERQLFSTVGAGRAFVQSERARLQKEVGSRFKIGDRGFNEAFAIWRNAHPVVERPSLPSDTWKKFWTGYTLTVPIMICFFIIRLCRKEQIVWIEAYRFVSAALVWPIAIWIYPVNQRRVEQMKQALQVLCYVQSIILSICGFWGIGLMPLKAQVKKAQTSGEMKKKERRNGFDRPVLGSELYYGGGVSGEGGLIVAPWYAITSHFGSLNISQFGFVELGEKKGQMFTNHALTTSYEHLPWAGFRTEAGGSPSGPFWSGGPSIGLHRTPGIRKIVGQALQTLSVARLGRIRGSGAANEIFFFWETRKVSTSLGKISIDGFYRIRPGSPTNVGQPRLLFLPKGWKRTTINYEAWMIGTKPTHRLGFEFSF